MGQVKLSVDVKFMTRFYFRSSSSDAREWLEITYQRWALSYTEASDSTGRTYTLLTGFGTIFKTNTFPNAIKFLVRCAVSMLLFILFEIPPYAMIMRKPPFLCAVIMRKLPFLCAFIMRKLPSSIPFCVHHEKTSIPYCDEYENRHCFLR